MQIRIYPLTITIKRINDEDKGSSFTFEVTYNNWKKRVSDLLKNHNYINRIPAIKIIRAAFIDEAGECLGLKDAMHICNEMYCKINCTALESDEYCHICNDKE